MCSDKSSEQFSEFLLGEYNNIANAFFNIKNSISLFFRYYILIASVPITVFLFFLEKKIDDKSLMFSHVHDLFGGICILVFFVGLGLMMYILSMNFTATKYARQVNGIRFYYYNKMIEGDSFKDKVRVLPIDNRLPEYSLGRSIKYLLFAFSTVNAFYLALGMQFFQDFDIKFFAVYWMAVVFLQWILCLCRVMKRSGNC